MKELFKKISDIESIAIDRGEQKLWAITIQKSTYFTKERGATYDGVEFDIDGVSVSFLYRPNYHCAGSTCITLNISELEKNDTEWKSYINELVRDRLKREAKNLKEKEKIIKNKELAEYNNLKAKYG